MNALPPPSAADVLVAPGPDATHAAASAEIGPEQAFAAVLARLQASAESIAPGADADAGERPGRGDDAQPAAEPDTASALDQVLLMTGMLPAQPPAAPVAVVSTSGDADAAPSIAEGNALPALARADRTVSDPAVDAALDVPLPA
ncbi:MAG TPA: hypothetical protein VFX05_06240, partial [Casimicrobiaceae bacterium]|nr:hypothetical protein [Casimicrobiaceae bacterium]